MLSWGSFPCGLHSCLLLANKLTNWHLSFIYTRAVAKSWAPKTHPTPWVIQQEVVAEDGWQVRCQLQSLPKAPIDGGQSSAAPVSVKSL